MAPDTSKEQAWEFHPLTAERWPDLVRLFAHHGNPGYCWCMSWRLSGSAYAALDSAGRRQALENIVCAGTPTGILGYAGGEPVGWCSIAPRETYTRLERSTTLLRLDDRPVWSVVCFFVQRARRGSGAALKLLRVAVAYACTQGARIVEGYPVESRDGKPVTGYRYMGSVSTFRKAGFQDAGLAANGRRIMRFTADKNDLA
ncbi:MAG: GNAT family N-acetyltransferase [Chloroflexi bacterium]|nr:GNAT family N-acetyltransferase [Chloroflexota bacterium]MCL5274948.1 GNAT family N-acetyltransferase [Chloroflexota bacterium]